MLPWMLCAAILLIAFMVTCFLTSWYRKYGPLAGLFPFGQESLLVRTKLENWRWLLEHISYGSVMKATNMFFYENKKYFDRDFLRSIDLVLVKRLDEADYALSFRDYCYNTFGQRYVIKVNVLKIHKYRIASNDFAELILQEYKTLYDMYGTK